MRTFTPFSSSDLDIARPIPRVPPVTTAFFPMRSSCRVFSPITSPSLANLCEGIPKPFSQPVNQRNREADDVVIIPSDLLYEQAGAPLNPIGASLIPLFSRPQVPANLLLAQGSEAHKRLLEIRDLFPALHVIERHPRHDRMPATG